MCSAVCMRVCLLVTTVCPAKTTEPIKMSIEWWTDGGQRNRVFGDGSDDTKGRGTFDGDIPMGNACPCRKGRQYVAMAMWPTGAGQPVQLINELADVSATGWRRDVVTSVVRRRNKVTPRRIRLVGLYWNGRI